MSQHYLPTTASPDLDCVMNQFNFWRNNRKKKNEKIPDELILSAGNLIGTYSLNEISTSLRMNQHDFKKRLHSLKIKTPVHLNHKPEFIELPPLIQHSVYDCSIEMEDSTTGSKMKINVSSIDSNGIIKIAKSFWGEIK